VRSVKRLSLGLLLIVLTSSILLLSDISRRKVAGNRVNRGRSAAQKSGLPKRWKIYFVQYNDVLDVEQAAEGVREGLRNGGLIEGRDYQIKTLNAQGDMATVSALIDAAITDNADLLVTFSTPTLQAAIRRAQSTPVVFAYVSNGLIAGAGKSETDHLPNLTGVNISAANEEMLQLIGSWFPNFRTLGTLFVPSEVNMVYQRDLLEQAARKRGFHLISVPVSTATEVPDAAAALAGRNIDAICQIPGNLTVSAFSSINQAAQRAHLPIFAFQNGQAHEGAVVVLARDYRDAGSASGALAVRVMRGEDPRNLPIEWYSKTRLVVNLDAARTLHLPLPQPLVQSAKEVIGTADGNNQTATR
jgi:ABC-type uncharacterized transport system substrate-binding protein